MFDEEYTSEWRRVHKDLGLSVTDRNGSIYASLTPVKEKEIVCFPKSLDTLGNQIFTVKKTFLSMGVESFNMGLYLPKDEEHPIFARFVDRGKLHKKTTDIGGVELLADESIVSADPFKLIQAFTD